MMRKLSLSSLKGFDKFEAALANDGLPDMVRMLKSKKKAKLLMEEVRKHILSWALRRRQGRGRAARTTTSF